MIYLHASAWLEFTIRAQIIIHFYPQVDYIPEESHDSNCELNKGVYMIYGIMIPGLPFTI